MVGSCALDMRDLIDSVDEETRCGLDMRDMIDSVDEETKLASSLIFEICSLIFEKVCGGLGKNVLNVVDFMKERKEEEELFLWWFGCCTAAKLRSDAYIRSCSKSSFE
jgi:hypothetical protein